MSQAISYKSIADSVLVSLNQIGNYTLEQAIIQSAKAIRAKLLRQDAERNKASGIYNVSFLVPLQNSELSDGCTGTGYCIVESIDILPEPVRLKDRAPFSFVGSLDGVVAATYEEIEYWKYSEHNKYTCNALRYDYINGRLVMKKALNNKIKFIGVKSAFVNPEAVVKYCTDIDNCITDSDPIVLPADMFYDIKSMLLKEYTPYTINNEVPMQNMNNQNAGSQGA